LSSPPKLLADLSNGCLLNVQLGGVTVSGVSAA